MMWYVLHLQDGLEVEYISYLAKKVYKKSLKGSGPWLVTLFSNCV
jgi:hypothetical protein